jgi:hypothetical protein
MNLQRFVEPIEDPVLGQAEGVRLAGPGIPAPSPNTNRPPLTSSSVSAVLAMIPGFRWSADRTRSRP